METETQQTVAAISRFQATKQKAERLLTLDKITANDLEDLDQAERGYIMEVCSQRLAQLTGVERDIFLDRIALIITPVTKSDIWEANHAVISNALSEYIQVYGSMPSKSAIAEKTGLSRTTITKHFETYKKQPEFVAQMEQFEFMKLKILANVCKQAIKGDMKAARLYLETVGPKNPPGNNTVVNRQNNYIQINNTILSPDVLKQLTTEQFNQIENIITGQRL